MSLRLCVARAGCTLDGGGVETVKIERVAKHLQQAQFFLLSLLIGDCDIASHQIGGLTQVVGKRVADLCECFVETVILRKDASAFLSNISHLICIEALKDGQLAHNLTNAGDFTVAHFAVGGRHHHHRVEKCCLGFDHFAAVLIWVGLVQVRLKRCWSGSSRRRR